MLSIFVARLCPEPQAKCSLLTVLPASSVLLRLYIVPVLHQLLRKRLEKKSFLSLLFLKLVRTISSETHTSPCVHPSAKVGGKTDSGASLSFCYTYRNCAGSLCHRETQTQESGRWSDDRDMFPYPQQFARNSPYQQQRGAWMNVNASNGLSQQHQMLMQQAMPQLFYLNRMPVQAQVMFKGNRPQGPTPGNMGQRQWNHFQQHGPQHNNRHRNNNKRKSSESGQDGRHTSSKMGRFQGDQFQQLNSSQSSDSSAMYMSVVNGVKPIYHVPGHSSCERITEAIVEYYNSYQQSKDDLQHKIVLSNCLYAIVRDIFPGCRLFIVGSTLSGFATHTSDMDLCLLIAQHGGIDQKCEAVQILNSIHKSLKDCTFIKSSQVIKAKVPILKFRDTKKNIECDLNINNGVGIRNTHLLKYYCLADNRVAPLMLFVKYWARFHDINDAHKRTISSYSLALMLIHYLQVCNPPVVPCLQMNHSERFNPTVDLRNLQLDEPLFHKPSENRDSLGQLFQGFLNYYAFTFRPEYDVVSVRHGCVLNKQIVQRNSQEPQQWKCLCVEEPFDLSNTARSVFDYNIFERVRTVFRRSAEELKKEEDTSAIFSQPF
ncbi:hypothetical protein ACOMHN_042271 [Nucella lapillus]